MSSQVRSRRPLRRLPLVVALLATALLPGCLTQALWTDELVRPGVPEYHVERIAEHTTARDGQVEVLMPRPGADSRLRFRSWAHEAPVILEPDAHDGEVGSTAALTSLLASDSCDVVGTRLLLERNHCLGEGVAELAEFELELWPRPGRIVAEVEAAGLPGAMRRLLDAPPPRFAFAAEPAAQPSLAEQCRRRLGLLDLATLLGVAGPVTVEQVVFCDEEGRITEPRRPQVVTDIADERGARVAELTEKERFERDFAVLTDQTMWATVYGGGRRRFLRCDAGELWMVCGAELRGDRLVHRSRWRTAAELPGATPQMLAVLPGDEKSKGEGA